MITVGEQISELFYFIAEDDLAHILPYFTFLQVKKGETLWHEGDDCDYMAFIVSGKLEESKETEFKGKQVVVGVVSDGSLIGDACMINQRQRGETVKALADTALLCLSLEQFEMLMVQENELAKHLLKSMLVSISTKLRHTVKRLAAVF